MSLTAPSVELDVMLVFVAMVVFLPKLGPKKLHSCGQCCAEGGESSCQCCHMAQCGIPLSAPTTLPPLSSGKTEVATLPAG